MEELSEALKAVERELNLARKVYRAVVFLYWAWAIAGVYLLAEMLTRYCGMETATSIPALSLLAIVVFVIEERKAFKKVLQLEEVLEKVEEVPKGYIIAQILVWPFSAVIASLYTQNDGSWMLVFIGLGLLLLASVELIFTGIKDWKTALAGLILLGSTTLYTGFEYAVVVIAFAFSLTSYLHLKGAMRE